MSEVHLHFDDGHHDPDDDPDHEPSENEQWYDAEVAPVLLGLARQCQGRGMSFVCTVEFGPGETGETCCLAEGAGIKARMAYWGAKARGNADSLIWAMIRHAREKGHGSVYLRMLLGLLYPGSREDA